MKISIVGFGRMGFKHYQACKLLNFDIVNVIEPNKKNLNLAIQKINNKNCCFFKKYNELYAKGNSFDCLIISTTTDYHYIYAKEALKNNIKKILIEKPVTNSINECLDLIKLKNKYKAKIAVNHQISHRDHYKFIRSLFQKAKFGSISSMNVLAGNCGVAMNGTHFIEGFRYLTNQDPYKISATLNKDKLLNPRGKKFADYNGIIRVVSKNKTRFYVDISENNGNGIVHVYTSNNAIVILDELSGKISIRVRKNKFSKMPSNKYTLPSDVIEKIVDVNDIVEATSKVIKDLKYGRISVSLEDALVNIKTITCAYFSSINGSKLINIEKFKKNKKFNWP